MRRGKLIGVGVGPGDPELVTVKAVRLLEGAPVVAFIAAAGRASRAREIAGPYLKSGIRELVAVMPMSADPAATQRAYGQLASGIISEIGQGHNVAFLCEGDPLLYGSFVHLVESLGPRFECEAIPGINSFSAAAAACMQPLAVREQSLGIIPATVPPRRLEQLLRDHERVVLLKVGRNLPKVRQALTAARMLKDAMLVENVSGAGERIRPLDKVTEDTAPYFALVLAHREREAAGDKQHTPQRPVVVERRGNPRPPRDRQPRERILRPRRDGGE